MVLSLGHASLPLSVLASPSGQLIDAHYGNVPDPLWDAAATIQSLGESAFTATFAVAFLQAAIALFQYRSNPAGELIVPPGPTIGIETPYNNKTTAIATTREDNADVPAVLRDINRAGSKKTTTTSRYARMLNRFNRSLFLLIPLASRAVGSLFARQWHVMHIGFIVSLVRFFDAPASFFEQQRQRMHPEDFSEDESSIKAIKRDRLQRVVVIGDSLAIGLGTVNVFDKNKNQTVDYRLTENLSASPDLPGPIFPRVLAAALAKEQTVQVHWRSAGVDGGTLSHIRQFCLGVISQEVALDRPPDCVVLLCGINDLKQFVSNPFLLMTPRDFRRNLSQLIVEIRQLCPGGTKVVLPALPTQMFRFNSPLNIFPLAVFLDTVVGFWESQKKVVVENFPSDDVMYVDLSSTEVDEWYRSINRERKGEKESMAWNQDSDGLSLIAADGVHPSASCYRKWAETVARRVLMTTSSR